jgi:signal transduction histidine kinase
MFITRKRHEREKLESFGVNSQISEALLRHVPHGVFLLDARDKVMPPVSRSLAVMFRRQDFVNLSFDRLLKPVVSASALSEARAHLKSLRASLTVADAPAASHSLKDIEVRLAKADGAFDTAYYSFEFNSLESAVEPGTWLVRVSDTTARVQQAHELEDLRSQLRVSGELLGALMRMGSARLGGALQRIDAAMIGIEEVLKKPARAEQAFRDKLEETLDVVDRVRRESVALKLASLEAAARAFEDALHELRTRSKLSGTDFLPLAVKLDDLSGQFAYIRSLLARDQGRESPADAAAERNAPAETEVMPAPKFVAQMAAAAAAQAAAAEHADAIAPATDATSAIPLPARNSTPGSLENTLMALTEVIAEESGKSVALSCVGLGEVPSCYQTAIKNIAVQLIRNAVLHGIETAEERVSAGKSPQGRLRLEFSAAAGEPCELMFEDDGRGLDAQKVRATAVAKGLVSAEAAAKLRDRQAFKLIFKSGFTTLADAPGDAHGAGLAMVRRYVHQVDGKISLASLPGHETRFKIGFPALPAAESEAQVA